MSSCRTCAYFDIENATDKAGRVQRKWAVKCKWESTEVWPESINTTFMSRPIPGYVTSDQGADCKAYKVREPCDKRLSMRWMRQGV